MIPGLLALGSTIGGKLIDGALGGGGSGAAAPVAAPVTNTATFAPVNFGARHLGDAAVKEAPAVISAENRTWTKFIPWIVGGLVAVLALALLPSLLRRRKGD